MTPRVPACPDWLTGPARDLWERAAPQLALVGALSDLTADAFAAVCLAYGRWRDAESKLAEQGAVVKSPNGYPVPNPYLAISRDAYRQFAQGARQFGLTPDKHKPRRATAPPQLLDDLDALLADDDNYAHLPGAPLLEAPQ